MAKRSWMVLTTKAAVEAPGEGAEVARFGVDHAVIVAPSQTPDCYAYSFVAPSLIRSALL
jgi:hypothetical protein